MNNIKFKKGWTLIELCVTLIALGILIGISIQTIKPRKLLVTPFTYAALKNLEKGNSYILNKCNTDAGGEGIAGCNTDGNSLPNISEYTLDNINAYFGTSYADRDVALAEVDDVYCSELADAFSLIGDRVNCKYNSGAGAGTKLPTGNGQGENAGVENFQTANMVSYYYLERPWIDILRAAPTDAILDGTADAQYKEIFIDINGNNKPNKLGEDQFPLRVYRSGEVIPSRCDNVEYNENPAGDHSGVMKPGVGYGCIGFPNWLDNNYPYSYYVVSATKDTTDEDAKYNAKRIVFGASYREAACKSGKNILIPRGTFCSSSGSSLPMSADRPAYDALGPGVCQDDPEHNITAFCFIGLTKPANPGIFKVPID